MAIALASSAQAQTGDPGPRFAAATSSDGDRARTIEALLKQDTWLRDDKLNVTVTGKRVRLSGVVDDEAERKRAEDIVWEADPTLVVENLLTVSEQKTTSTAAGRAVDEVVVDSKKAARKAGKAVNEMGEMVNDGWITSKIKTQLMGTDGVKASAINVDTNDHVVTLRGTVRSESERAKALHIARATRGVVKVVDELKVQR
jgi:osmotically-inducible protein OsmY